MSAIYRGVKRTIADNGDVALLQLHRRMNGCKGKTITGAQARLPALLLGGI